MFLSNVREFLREYFNGWTGRAALVLVSAVAGALFVTSLGSAERSISDVDSIAYEWNSTIAKLGIEPIYPPQEDVLVGDVFAVITSDEDERTSAGTFASRAQKLHHLDLTPALLDAYKTTYRFPETKEPPAKKSDLWKSSEGATSIFKAPEELRGLPIVIFPGLSAARTQSTTAGITAVSNPVARMLGFSRQTEAAYDINIAGAETYGIPSIPATAALLEFCTLGATKGACSERFLRSQLSMLVGKRIFDSPSGKGAGKAEISGPKFRFGVEVWLVNRIYTARLVDVSARAGVRSRLQAGGDAKGSAGASEPPAPATGADPSSTTAQIAELRDQLAKQERLLTSITRGLSSSSDSGIFLRDGGADRQLDINNLLPRPVVIGFRAVRTRPLGE